MFLLKSDLSPASSAYRAAHPRTSHPKADIKINLNSITEEDEEGGDAEEDNMTPSVQQPGGFDPNDLEVELSPELIEAFKISLSQLRISLRFFGGTWESFSRRLLLEKEGLELSGPLFDIVLTSETIYRVESLPGLLKVLCHASSTSSSSESICLVAAKVVYFGVGGGVNEFLAALESGMIVGSGKVTVEQSVNIRGNAQVVWEENRGVARKIMSLKWNLS